MSIKQIIAAAIIGLSVVTNAFAQVEDWTGQFTVQSVDKKTMTIKHDSSSVSVCGMKSKQWHFAKGSSFNGIVMNSDITLSPNSNVDDFASQVSLIGTIIDKTITLGPSYTIK